MSNTSAAPASDDAPPPQLEKNDSTPAESSEVAPPHQPEENDTPAEESDDEHPPRPEEKKLPVALDRVGALMRDIMLFCMYTSSVNYDAYFITPALMALHETEFRDTEFLDFFAEEFSFEKHASDFHFSETETRAEFAKRFFSYIADAKNVPLKIRDMAAKFAKHYKSRFVEKQADGFIKPVPLYGFVRVVTMLGEASKCLREVDLNIVEVVINFLLKKFDPKDYGIPDDARVEDIQMALFAGFGDPDEEAKLCDGTRARVRNKEVLERLATEEIVPQNVKDAIAVILPQF